MIAERFELGTSNMQSYVSTQWVHYTLEVCNSNLPRGQWNLRFLKNLNLDAIQTQNLA